MSDEEEIALCRRAFQFGQQMRAAIADSDSEERKSVRTEWTTFRNENQKHDSSLLVSYYYGIENITAST